ncbi:NADP-dependent oxidoreductase [Sphingobacterium paramultivorum]|uniref:NADP-dependent oxidoreductase n=1 Tax=Sphingobacterium paramultivorum TaxID=2886510 RepID=A0A7G5E4J2_9SPHI|nr:NADP-dependent oxidoreductase [Sphingobacterium paramultivorum]QMV68917.1 NADP-dependent oxidoreductase [Sphingobacterium paramultivorum]WSO12693.1 NADP-dependent oxidoreductase [Sphingobacterium paramultivorum]
MNAVILDQDNQLINVNVDLPEVKPNEVKIKIIASAINPIDYQMRENEFERRYLYSPILGREGAGIITDKGSDVSEYAIGDEVFFACGSMGSNGTYAAYIQLPAGLVAPKPKNISFEQAAALPTAGITALQVFDRATINPQDHIFLTGASGGVGLFVLKLLLANGIKNIVATAGSMSSIEKLHQLGLQKDSIINYRKENLTEIIKRRSNQQGIDVAIDAVGQHLSEVAAAVLKPYGTYIDITHFTTTAARDQLFSSAAQIINISNFTHAQRLNYPYFKNGLDRIRHSIEQEIIQPAPIYLIGDLSAETIEKGHLMLKNNQTQGNKLIIQNQ